MAKLNENEAMKNSVRAVNGDSSHSFRKLHYKCCVPKCTLLGSVNKTHERVTYHKFPADRERRKEWIANIRGDSGPPFQVKRHGRVCSRHFTQDSFKYTPVKRTLKPNAVPTVFDWPTQNDQRPPEERSPLPHRRHTRVQSSDTRTECDAEEQTEEEQREDGPSSAGAESSAEDQTVEEQEEDDRSWQKFPIKIELPEDPEETTQQPTVEALQQRILELEAQLRAKDEELNMFRAERLGVAMYAYDGTSFSHHAGLPTGMSINENVESKPLEC